jgi:hypothetical protein
MDDQKTGPQPPVPSPNQPGGGPAPRQPGSAAAAPPPRPPAPTGTAPTPRPPAAPQPYDIPTLGEEFDQAKWTLPPAQIVAIAIAGVAIVLAIVMYMARYKPVSAGSLGDVASVELADHNSVLVAINVTVRNIGEKPLWIHEMGAEVETDKGKFSDHAASAIDFDRYYQAYPTLKQKALPALMPEMKIAPGGEQKGTIIVSFPVNEDTFNKRKSLSVTVEPYDQRALVISSGSEAGK